MAISNIPLRIAQVSDVHVGGSLSLPEALEGILERLHRMQPDIVVIAGIRRERNIVLDAGDLLYTLTDRDIDLVLSGHKHVPFFWGVNGMLICNSGTAGSRRVRAGSPPSWNELHIDAATIKVFTHYLDGRRELSVIFSRKTRVLTREAFYLTDDFRRSNQIAAV